MISLFLCLEKDYKMLTDYDRQLMRSLQLNLKQYREWQKLWTSPTKDNPEFNTFWGAVCSRYGSSLDFSREVIAEWVKDKEAAKAKYLSFQL